MPNKTLKTDEQIKMYSLFEQKSNMIKDSILSKLI